MAVPASQVYASYASVSRKDRKVECGERHGLVDYSKDRHEVPSPYKEYDKPHAANQPKWNLKTWSRRKIVIAIATGAVVLIVVIVGLYYGLRSWGYPKYTPIQYELADTYSGTDFFDKFDYFTGYDPTYGFVHTAMSEQYNLTYATADAAVLKVDTTEQNASTGRFSVRITSKQHYSSGLFIFDILKTPYGCSTWPALWLTDPANWPDNGEIDVVETTNQGSHGNQVTLHTTKGCKMDVKRKQTGNALKKNCDHEAHDNAGCGVSGGDSTYGQALNADGGGIYAMEWRDAGIRVWFFPRDSIPADIPDDISNTTAPDPGTWDEPLADFPSTHCDISNHFRNQSIVANIDLCGQLAGAVDVYSKQDGCPGTCSDFVATHPEAFETAYWEWKSWRVYTAAS